MLLKIKLIKVTSTSERTFGSKLANAEKVSVNLKTYVGFTPPTAGISIVNYDALIASLKTENTGVAKKKITQRQSILGKSFFLNVKMLL
jgi:hypothetical protein